MPAPTSPEPVRVVAAVISRAGHLLLGRRPDHKHHGGLWEFPGGKLEVGESWRAAASREIEEELGLTVEAMGPLRFESDDPGSPYRIRFYDVDVSGTLEAREHAALGWYTPEELVEMPLAPSDAAFVRTLFEG